MTVNQELDLVRRAENGGNLGRTIPQTDLLFLKISRACREPLGRETCRRAHVESLGAEWPPGRTSKSPDTRVYI